jgi:hypothetical protein
MSALRRVSGIWRGWLVTAVCLCTWARSNGRRRIPGLGRLPAAAARWRLARGRRWLRVAVMAIVPLALLARSASGDAAHRSHASSTPDPGSANQPEHQYEQWLAWLRAPAQVSARAHSWTAYADESASQARVTDDHAFPGQVGSGGYQSLPASGGRVLDRLGANDALVQRPHGSRAILESILPLDGKTAEGSPAPLNLKLHPHDGSFVPESSLVPVSIPTESDGEVAFPSARFGLRVAGGAPAAGEQSGGSVLYPNVGGRSRDTDALVRAMPTGADVSFLLRSHTSPQSQTLSFDLPMGWRLHDARDPAGSVNVLSGSGKVMGRVLPPLAVDAQGQTVRARYHILGPDQLKLTVFHNAGDYAYPILVDPIISTDYQTTSMYSNWEQASNDSANFTASDPSGYSDWKMGEETTYSAGQYGEYIYTPPAGAYVYELTESGVEHSPDKSEEYGGIWASSGGWESGTWQNLTNGNNGSTAERTTTGSLSGDDYEYCAHGGGPGVTCPAQPSSPIDANNLAVFGLEATGGNEGSSNGADELSDATVYLSDTVTPTLTVSHSNYQQGHWTGTGDDYSDTVTATGSETSGLGMSELTIAGPSGFTATPHPSKTWQCSTAVPNVSNGKPAPMPCPSSVNTSFTYSTSSLPEGDNAITVTATSAAGNTATKTWHILIDRTPPTASVSCDQGTSGWSNAASSTCTITGSDPNNSNGSSGSGLATLEYRTQTNGGSWSGWTTVSSGAQFSVSAEGTTNVQAQAVDNAGNIYTTPSTAVELDRTAPTASLSCPGSGAWANTAVTCTVTGSDPANSSNGSTGSGLQTLEYRTQVNGGSWSGWTTVSSGAQFSVSAEGTTSVQAQAIDNAGNNYTTPSTTVEIDGTPPSVSVSCPGSGSWSNAASVTCTVTGSDPQNASNGSSGSGLQTLEYQTQTNGGSWSGWTTVSSGAQFSVSAEGTTNVQAQAVDNAGNIYTTPSTAVELDQTAPTLTLSGTLASDNGQAVGPGQYPLDFTVQDGAGSTSSSGAAMVTVTVDGTDQNGVSFTPCYPGPCQGSGSWTLDTTNMAVGPHAIAVTAVDGAGNSTTQNLSITVPPAGSGTQVSSNINADTTWTAAGSPYVLDANVHVDGGVTLTIDPGVTVEFNNGQSATFTVDGTIDSDGVSGNPVTFISSQVASGSGAPGQYMGIDLTSGSSQFSYTNFYYGGYGSAYNSYGELTVSGGSVSIDHSTFQDNQDSGLDASGGAATVSYSKFENNGDGITGVGGAPGPLFLSHSTVADNASVGVFFNITSNSTTSSSLLYDTITGNGSSGVDLQESCSNSPSSFPHGEWNNIYANKGLSRHGCG